MDTKCFEPKMKRTIHTQQQVSKLWYVMVMDCSSAFGKDNLHFCDRNINRNIGKYRLAAVQSWWIVGMILCGIASDSWDDGVYLRSSSTFPDVCHEGGRMNDDGQSPPVPRDSDISRLCRMTCLILWRFVGPAGSSRHRSHGRSKRRKWYSPPQALLKSWPVSHRDWSGDLFILNKNATITTPYCFTKRFAWKWKNGTTNTKCFIAW